MSLRILNNLTASQIRSIMASIQVLERIAHVTSILLYSVWYSSPLDRKFLQMRMEKRLPLNIQKELRLYSAKMLSKQYPQKMHLLSTLLTLFLIKLKHLTYSSMKSFSILITLDRNQRFGEDTYPTIIQSLSLITLDTSQSLMEKFLKLI